MVNDALFEKVWYTAYKGICLEIRNVWTSMRIESGELMGAIPQSEVTARCCHDPMNGVETAFQTRMILTVYLS